MKNHREAATHVIRPKAHHESKNILRAVVLPMYYFFFSNGGVANEIRVTKWLVANNNSSERSTAYIDAPYIYIYLSVIDACCCFYAP